MKTLTYLSQMKIILYILFVVFLILGLRFSNVYEDNFNSFVFLILSGLCLFFAENYNNIKDNNNLND